jgi:hypothetical protein
MLSALLPLADIDQRWPGQAPADPGQETRNVTAAAAAGAASGHARRPSGEKADLIVMRGYDRSHLPERLLDGVTYDLTHEAPVPLLTHHRPQLRGVSGFEHERKPHRRELSHAGLNEPNYSTRGSVSNWWNGGGDGSVHSSVVAPMPQGLAGASLFRTKAKAMPMRNTTKPTPEMYDPIDET